MQIQAESPVKPDTTTQVAKVTTTPGQNGMDGFAESNAKDNYQLIESDRTSNCAEEVNTKEVAQQITAELKRYSIPQAIFAQRVLCRSQVSFN